MVRRGLFHELIKFLYSDGFIYLFFFFAVVLSLWNVVGARDPGARHPISFIAVNQISSHGAALVSFP